MGARKVVSVFKVEDGVLVQHVFFDEHGEELETECISGQEARTLAMSMLADPCLVPMVDDDSLFGFWCDDGTHEVFLVLRRDDMG